jgi:hypothetical protein
MTYKDIKSEYQRLFKIPVIQNCWIADVKRELGITTHIAYNRKDKSSVVKPCPEKIKNKLKSIIAGYNLKRIQTNTKIKLKSIFNKFTVTSESLLVFSDSKGKKYGIRVQANKNINLSSLIKDSKMPLVPEYVEFKTIEYITDVQIKFPAINRNIIVL